MRDQPTGDGVMDSFPVSSLYLPLFQEVTRQSRSAPHSRKGFLTLFSEFKLFSEYVFEETA